MKISGFKVFLPYFLLPGCLWALATGEQSMNNDDVFFSFLLPDTVYGWTREAESRYNKDNLYDYIDGGAELYLSYGFLEMINFTYSREQQPSLVVDVFDMGRSENAYGVFTYSRETIDTTFGQGSQYNPGLLIFWKDRWYISILASPETPESRNAMFELAAVFDKKIARKGPLPKIISLLPKQDRLDASIRYFKHPVWLNSYYFISEQNLFHIDSTTDAVLSKYRDGSLLLLVTYPEVNAAEAAFRDFLRNFMPENPPQHVLRIEDGSWVACRLSGNAVKAVFKASGRENALELLDRVPEFR